MGKAIRWGAAMVGALALPVLGVIGCTSNPLISSDVLFLQVYELQVGTGREAAAGDRVVIDYVVWVYDSESDSKGQELDSRTGYTFFLGANQVIPAFDQGVAGMRVGGIRRLVIPPAYAGGAFGSVSPDTAFVAEVVLVDAQTVSG